MSSVVSQGILDREHSLAGEPGSGAAKSGGPANKPLRDDTVVVRSAAATGVMTYLNPLHVVNTLWPKRDLIRQFTGREVLERNRGSHLGWMWNVLSPLLQLAAFTFVFSVIFRKSWGNIDSVHPTLDFVFNLFVGQTFFHIFADALGRAPVCIASRPNFVRKVVFPVEILPVSVVFSGIVYEMIALGLLLVLLTATTGNISPTLWTLPIVMLPLVMMCLGLAWFLASIGAFFRDVRNVTVVITQLLMFMSAIFYPLSAVPEEYRGVMMLNPLVVIIESGRRAIITGEQPWWGALGAVTVVSFVVMMLGYAWFMKSRKSLADVV